MGEHTHPNHQTRFNLGTCTTSWPTNWSHGWLFASGGWRITTPPPSAHTHKHCPYLFTSLRKYLFQNQFTIPFTHRGGWAEFRVVFTCWIRRSDRKRSVLSPSKYKTKSQFRYEYVNPTRISEDKKYKKIHNKYRNEQKLIFSGVVLILWIYFNILMKAFGLLKILKGQ